MTVNITEKSLIHSVTPGDFGIPILTGVGIWHFAAILNIIYLPLGIAESFFWNIYPREYDFNWQKP